MNTQAARLDAASMDEAAIVRRVAAGDRAAFELLMRRYNRRLYRLARASLHDEAEAKDALQDAYLSAFRSMGQFRGESRLSTWLSRLVLNECLARQRRSSRRQNVIPMVSSDSNAEAVASVADDSDPPDRAAGRAQMRAVLERKVSELPEIFRVVFILRSVEELSVEETAQCLDLTEETVRSRHFRAKSLLRESLARELDLAERDLFEFGGTQCDETIAAVLARLRLGRLPT
jgi:RNA polymerase sigma factor (sigma-70 family)